MNGTFPKESQRNLADEAGGETDPKRRRVLPLIAVGCGVEAQHIFEDPTTPDIAAATWFELTDWGHAVPFIPRIADLVGGDKEGGRALVEKLSRRDDPRVADAFLALLERSSDAFDRQFLHMHLATQSSPKAAAAVSRYCRAHSDVFFCTEPGLAGARC